MNWLCRESVCNNGFYWVRDPAKGTAYIVEVIGDWVNVPANTEGYPIEHPCFNGMGFYGPLQPPDYMGTPTRAG